MAEQPAGYFGQVALAFLKRLCLATVILQTDGEAAIVDLAEAVAQVLPKTVARKTPSHSSQGLAGLARTMRAQLEMTCGVTM